MKNRISIATTLILLLISSTAFSNARDSDGSRMQARAVALGKTIKDNIRPPGDAVDWYYFRLEKEREVKLSLNIKSKKEARLTLSDTVGKSILQNRTKAQRLTMKTQKLKPGIYYVSVSAKSAFSYSLLIK